MKRILLFPEPAPDTGANTAAQEVKKLTPEQEKARAVQAYYEAPDRAAKAAVVRQYPVLKTVFSEANHS